MKIENNCITFAFLDSFDYEPVEPIAVLREEDQTSSDSEDPEAA